LSDKLLREMIREILFESEGAGLEAHILSFYEDVDMPLSELREVFEAVLSGHLEDVQEKMDGQALTFTVKDGRVEGFSKGATWARVQAGGMTADMFSEKYADRPTVQHAYVASLRAIEAAVNADPALTDMVFQGGKVVVETAMLVPTNPNTIPYEKHHVRFIRAEALAPDTQVDQAAYEKFTDFAGSFLERMGADVQIGSVPILPQKAAPDAPALIADLNTSLDMLMSETGLSDSSTIGDLIAKLVTKKLSADGIEGALAERVAARLMGNKAAFSAADAKRVGPGFWERVQAMEKMPYVDEAMIPFERIIQKLGLHLFRTMEFVLASNDTTSGERLRAAVKRVRDDFEDIKSLVDPKRAEGIRVALARIGDNADDFEKAVEGVVFRWKGKLRKITGMFTAFNKLRGFFAYSGSPALAAYFDAGAPLEQPTNNTTNETRMRRLQRNWWEV
jgi:hypothetical protein